MPSQSRSEPQSESLWRPECAICKGFVSLEESNADEHGHAVHEDCYVSKHCRPLNEPTA
jgi:hypothetical protein